MADIVKFNLEEMDNVYQQASEYETTFKNGIEEIQGLIQEIGGIWTSDETGTYEAFKELFDNKVPTLLEGDNCMKEFCNKIDEKRQNFETAASDTIKSFI